MKRLVGIIVGILGLFLFVVPVHASEVVYDALPSVSPITNYPSQPFQAQQTAEFGDYIHLGGTARVLKTVTVTMSDWALFSDYSSDPRYQNDSTNWTHPITLNVYSVNPGTPNTVGSLLGTETQTITIPWRPEPDGCDATGWTDSNNNCNHGLAFNATFDLSSLNITLPNDIIVSVAFNTQTWGYNPIGTTGPYNSLNVAVPPNQPVSVGSDYSNGEVFWNTHTCSYYYDGGADGCNIFREDTNWSPYGTVALQVVADTPPIVASVNGGGHLLEGDESTKRKDLLDISFGGWINKLQDNTLLGDFEVVLHNVNKKGLDKTEFHGSDVISFNLYASDSPTCNDAVNFTVNGIFNGSPASIIFRAGDFGSPNTLDTARVTIYSGQNGTGTVLYDTHSSGEFTDKSNCVGTARTGLDNGNITIWHE